MFKIENKSEVVYLYDRWTNNWVNAFPTIEDALKFIVFNGFDSWNNEYYFFDKVNLCDDTYRNAEFKSYINEETGERVYTTEVNYYSRQYMFIDGDNRILDLRIYRRELDELRKNNDNDFKTLWKKKKKYYRYFYNKENIRFRIDPVPYTGRHRHFCCSLRAVRTMNEIRQNSNPEHKDYVRPARRPHNLPTIYDDIWRPRSRSWKDCTKKRKQWMK